MDGWIKANCIFLEVDTKEGAVRRIFQEQSLYSINKKQNFTFQLIIWKSL